MTADDALTVLRRDAEMRSRPEDSPEHDPDLCPACAVDVLARELSAQQEWIDRVSLASTEAATAADKAERERDALAVQVEQLREALRGIERYAYDAILDGHPSIPEMGRVQNRAMRALEAGSTTP